MEFYKGKKEKKQLRHKRIRSRVKGSAESPRLSVFRSNVHIYAQLIDDEKNITLASASDSEVNKEIKAEKLKKDAKTGKAEAAYMVGKLIAAKAVKLGVKKAVFDRGGNKYHGRVKAVAEGAREGGLKF